MLNLFRRRGAHLAVGLAAAALVHATPGQAVIPAGAMEIVAEADASDVSLSPQETDAPDQVTHVGEGVASYYGTELAGNRTASGERFDPQALTAAHRTLAIGSKLRVTNKANGKSVVVRVNDRGPHARGRILDLSLAAARKIAMVSAGTAKVRIDLLS